MLENLHDLKMDRSKFQWFGC